MSKKLGTKCVHSGGISDDKYFGNITPIYPSITYDYLKSDVYPRYFNTPNQLSVCKKIAELENAEDAVLFGSGLAAVASSMFSLLKTGDHVILQKSLYGGTINLVNSEFKKFKISYDYVDVSNKNELGSYLKDNTKIIYIESPSNPLLSITDIRAISEFAKQNNLISIIDNTFASPVNQNPIELGIDLVIHSATKYLGGHSDILAGTVCGSNELISSPLISSSIISLHKSTHSLQIYTLGPAINFLTSSWDLPQNEQLSLLDSVSLLIINFSRLGYHLRYHMI